MGKTSEIDPDDAARLTQLLFRSKDVDNLPWGREAGF
jgi:hypothetical protein